MLYMSQDHHPISREMQIRLDGVGAHGDSLTEGEHGVLGIKNPVAAVGYVLREVS